MSETRTLLTDTAERLFASHAAKRSPDDAWPEPLWREAAELGFPLLLVPEAAGGIGGSEEDSAGVLFSLGRHCLPIPLAEAMLAESLAVAAGLPPAHAPVTLAPHVDGVLDEFGRFTGRLTGVPFGRHVAFTVAVLDELLVRLPTSGAAIAERANMAGEPRDDLLFASVAAEIGKESDATRVLHAAALLRTCQIAGALQAALDLTVSYAGERSQFGRKIGAFQAVQHQLAIMAEHVAAVRCASLAAARAASLGDARFEIAAGKLRANMAIEACTAIAHQVHGAIGFTAEYALQRVTRRLWSWRGELGNDRHWASALGGLAAAAGPEGFWAELTRRSDAASPP